jgi:YaiO family outer membrane protein
VIAGRFNTSGFFALVFLGVLTSTVIAHAENPDTLQTLLQAGKDARADGNHRLAADKYSRALTLSPKNVDVLYLLGTSLAFSERLEEAYKVLTKALTIDPENIDVRLARIRSAAWANNYAAAEDDMQEALRLAPANAEVFILGGWLHYVQKRPREAAAAYQSALKLAPGSKRAAKGLEDARRAIAGIALARTKLANKTQKPEPEDKKRWRFDASYLQSSFSRVSRERWQEPSIALAYTLSDRWTVNGHIDYSRRFGLKDVRIEGGAAYRFDDGHNAYLNVGLTPEDDFLAKYRILAGGLYSIDLKDLGLPTAGPAHLKLDVKREFYENGVSDTFNPAITQYFGQISGTARWINSWSPSNKRTFGWLIQANWQIRDRTLVYFGKADAPETVEQATIGQRSVFAGIVTGLSKDTDIRFDFAREDRENSYIRRVLGVGLTVRF